MSSDRHWMYARIRDGFLNREFIDGLETFIQFATSQPKWMDDTRIRCPCNQKKCQNMKFLDVPTVKYHLARYGFVPNYYVWRFQGESNVRSNVERDAGGPDGGPKKQRIYGLRTHATSFIPNHTGASSSATSHIDLDTIRRESGGDAGRGGADAVGDGAADDGDRGEDACGQGGDGTVAHDDGGATP